MKPLFNPKFKRGDIIIHKDENWVRKIVGYEEEIDYIAPFILAVDYEFNMDDSISLDIKYVDKAYCKLIGSQLCLI